MNLAAISSAIAARFASGTITPPAGESAPKAALAVLPDNIGNVPTFLVYPPTWSSSWGIGKRYEGDYTFRVVLYLGIVGDLPRRHARALAWHDAMIFQLGGQRQLGLETYVEESDVTGGAIRLGQAGDSYADFLHDIVELVVEVKVRETVAGLGP